MTKKKADARWSGAVDWSVLAKTGKKTNKNCRGCIHADPDLFCFYSVRVGHRRPCKMHPGGGCDVKQTRNGAAPSVHPDYIITPRQIKAVQKSKKKTKVELLEENPKAAKLYDKGASDLQIATACGVSKQTVLTWRQRTGRPSHWKNRRKDM